MNTYRYPLIASGAFLMLWAACPAFALQSEAESEERAFNLEAIASPDNPFGKDSPLPEVQDASLSFDRGDRQGMELAQMPPSPPAGDVMVPQPDIIIKSNGSGTPDILEQAAPAAPTLPRAVAPPVGDMAISNINAAPDLIDMGSSAIVPRLVLRQAPAREVLAVLARYAGMNLVFTDTPGGGAAGAEGQAPAVEPVVSLDLENEPVQAVFNSVLMISGLQANRRGKTIFVGAQLPQAAQNLVSRTLRLNQVKSFNAGTFLASQGAEFQRLVTKTEDITDPLTGRVIGRREIPSNLEAIQVSLGEGGTAAPLLLRGLRVSADDRMNSITLVGEPRQVQVATSLITQLDARRRQVAVNVKVVDINLNNIQDYSSSFSFGVNDSFFIQDNGAAILRFGSTSPVTGADINSATGRAFNPPVIPNPVADSNTFINPNETFTIPDAGIGTVVIGEDGSLVEVTRDATFFGRTAGVSADPTRAGITEFTPGTPNVFTRTFDPTTGRILTTVTRGAIATATSALPTYFQYPRQFQALIDAQIRSGNAKILTDPTLVVQEGQEASVKLTQKVVESIDSQVDPLSGVRTTTPVLADAGLTLAINVDKIDDNGFVSISVSPTIAAPGAVEIFDSGGGAQNRLTLLQRRELTSGLVRLRDGQTFILSGVIQETDRTETSKVPILGDIPILGALFRSSSNRTDRTEVIILLTPQILDDNTESQFGFNYTPGKDAAGVLRQQGFPVQVQP